MLCSQTVLEWPYGDFEQMIPCSSIDLSDLPVLSAHNVKSLFKRPCSSEARPRPVQAELQGKSLRGHYISNTDRNKGHVAEEAFAAAIESLATAASDTESTMVASADTAAVKTLPHFSHNYLKHIDFEISSGGQSFWVDVKSPKSLRKTINKADLWNRPQDKYICFELNSSGSLFGSHSDYVAFGLTTGSFILADRLKLIEIVNAKMDFSVRPKERSAWPETSLWQPYVRTYNNNHLVMAYMDLEDLRPSFLFLVGHVASSSTVAASGPAASGPAGAPGTTTKSTERA